MKYFAVFALFIVTVVADNQFCFRDVTTACNTDSEPGVLALPNCNATYGGMEDHHLQTKLQKYANLHILRSFEYLIVSTHFANYVTNRAGFEKLFRKLSDETWEDGIDLIKHIGMRGAVHNFNARPADDLLKKGEIVTYEQFELPSMSRAVDVQKDLAKKAFEIHNDAIHKHDHDAEIAQYIEEKFAEKHAEQVSKLVGHVSDLKKFAESKDASLALHIFDDYLQKA